MSKILVGGHEITVHKDYSTSEVFTGQYWIDGKPIYRKTYQGNMPTITGGQTSHSVIDANLNTTNAYLINTYGTVEPYEPGQIVKIPFTFTGWWTVGGTSTPIPAQAIWVDVINTGVRLLWSMYNSTYATQFSGKPYYITVEYTKLSE